MSIIDPMTTEERYTRAIGSSHLEMKDHRFGDVEVVIAAGWLRDSLGTKLYRLAAEWDLVRGDLDRVRDSYVPQAALLARLQEDRLQQGKVRHPGPTQAGLLLPQAERERQEAVLQARAFALLALKSLQSTALAFGEWAVQQASKPSRALFLDDEKVRKLAGRVLDSWLDSRCDRCGGTGRKGTKGENTVPCRACAGTGRRTALVGDTVEQQHFARWMLTEMEHMTSEVDRTLRRYLSGQQGC